MAFVSAGELNYLVRSATLLSNNRAHNPPKGLARASNFLNLYEQSRLFWIGYSRRVIPCCYLFGFPNNFLPPEGACESDATKSRNQRPNIRITEPAESQKLFCYRSSSPAPTFYDYSSSEETEITVTVRQISTMFFLLSDIMNLCHQSSVMWVIMLVMLGKKTHTRGLQRKKETPYQPLSQ